MPRRLRVHVPDGIYHVILRGNNREPLFKYPADRDYWESLLAKGIDRYGCRVHGYCWMTNHVHMVVQVADIPLGKLVRWISNQYARWFNQREQRTGHLFERRHRAVYVTEEGYLGTLVRYMHRNPVDAKIVDTPAEYAWCSHRDYVGQNRHDWLCTTWVLSMFGPTPEVAKRAFSSFVSGDDEQEGRQSRKGDDVMFEDGGFEVDTDFSKPQNDSIQITLDQIIQQYCSEYGVTEQALTSPNRCRRHAKIRALITVEALNLGTMTISTIARRFGRCESAVYRTMKKYRND